MTSPEQGALPGGRAHSAVAQAPCSGLGPCTSLHVGLTVWNMLLKLSFPVPVFSPYCKAGLATLYIVRGDVGTMSFLQQPSGIISSKQGMSLEKWVWIPPNKVERSVCALTKLTINQLDKGDFSALVFSVKNRLPLHFAVWQALSEKT